jgi:hypothetical protein
MTPQERQLVDELFDRLATLENSPRDPDAERAIVEGLRRAPNAVYALVQTTLVQDEALKRAHARIEELEGGGPPPNEQPRGFLDSIRDTMFGREEPPRQGSVPNARTGGLGASGAWGAGPSGPPPVPQGYGQGPGPGPGYGPGPGQGPGYGQPPGYGYGPGPAPVGSGGSFLGTAAASAAGAIGGAMLFNGIRSLFGPGSGHASSAFDAGPSTGSPWGGGNAANSDLARQAGIDNIGTSRSASRDDNTSGSGDNRSGFVGGNDDHDDHDESDTAYDDSDDDTDMAGDFGGDDSDNA